MAIGRQEPDYRAKRLWERAPRPVRWAAQVLPLCVLLVCSAGCGASAGGTGLPGPKGSGPPHALAWVRQDGQGIPQVWASVNDRTPNQITHQAGPAPACGNAILGAPMLAPDLRYIAVADGNTCGSGQVTGQLLIIDVATGHAAPAPLPGGDTMLTDERSYGWIDASTLFAVGSFGGMQLTLGAATPTLLPGLPGSTVEAVARGQTLFFLTADRSTAGSVTTYHAMLHRYDLGAQRVMAGAIDLGRFTLCQCAPGNYHFPGWDASPDGTHVVYQLVAPEVVAHAAGASPVGIASQAIYYAGADGSNASQIVHAVVTKSLVRMRLSPNGQLVGITEAHDAPDVLSGCVGSSGILYADPCLQFYAPDAFAFPAWPWNSAYMVAATAPAGASPQGDLYRYTPGLFHGTQYVAGGYNPWSVP
jgi:hypothetical protein